MEKTCLRCKRIVPENARFCRFCGSNEFETAHLCPYCKGALPNREINFCPTCGKRVNQESVSQQRAILAPEGEKHNCGICRQVIETDLVFCPSCTNAFHFNHLSSWIVDKNSCPICKTKLIFAQ